MLFDFFPKSKYQDPLPYTENSPGIAIFIPYHLYVTYI